MSAWCQNDVRVRNEGGGGVQRTSALYIMCAWVFMGGAKTMFG